MGRDVNARISPTSLVAKHHADGMPKVLQLLSRLEIGGMGRAVVRLASRGVQEGMDHTLVLFDKPFRSELLDFNPGTLVTEYIQRGPGIDLRFASKLARKFSQSRISVVHAHNDTAIF